MKKTFYFILLFVFFCLFAGSYFYYRHLHPKYIPLPPRLEVTLTIIPGWDLRQVAEYLVSKKLATSTEDVYKITGESAKDYRLTKNKVDSLSEFTSNTLVYEYLQDKPAYVSYEGMLAPETYRVFSDASIRQIVDKLAKQRVEEINNYFNTVVQGVPDHPIYDILILASILEKEVKSPEDKAMVADIFWRRLGKGWALQSDATVIYAVQKSGSAALNTTGKERATDSPWNTYKYPGLPLSPICNPSMDSIKAAIYPTKNNYWYFLTDKNGVVHYAKTLDEHNQNRVQFL